MTPDTDPRCVRADRADRANPGGRANRGGRARRPALRRQRGYALLMGLIMLGIGSLLAVSLYRSFGLEGRIAGNTLDKQRSLQLAESVLRYGEWWLTQGVAGSGVLCSGPFNAGSLLDMKACTTPLDEAMTANLPWPDAGTYVPSGMTVLAGGGHSASGDINYALAPRIYIGFLGPGPDGLSRLYQVNALAFGGSASTATVVRSVFMTTQRIRNLGEP